MGKHGFLSGVFRSLEQMEKEIDDLCGCFNKHHREEDCCSEKGRSPRHRPQHKPSPRGSSDDRRHCPPPDFRPPCGRELCCCRRENKAD